MSRVAPSRAALRGVVVSAAVLLAAACGSAGGSPGGTGSGGPSSGAAAAPGSASPSPVLTVCQDVASLRAALHSLASVSITEGAVSEIKAVARGIQTSLSGLGGSAGTEWRTQIGKLKSALANLQSAADDLAASPSRTGVATVTSRVADVAGTGRRLLAAIGNRCPAPPASPASSSA